MRSKKISVFIAVAAIAFATLLCVYSASMSEKSVAAFRSFGGGAEKTCFLSVESCPDCKDDGDCCPDHNGGDHSERRVKKPHRHRKPAPDKKRERQTDDKKA